MKSKYTLGFVASLFVASLASADTIALWTFETSVPTTSGPISPESGAGTASSNNADGVFSNPAGWGAASAESWSGTTWAVGDYFQFQVSTVGFEDIAVGFNQTGSNTGPGAFDFQYSVDGVSFVSAGTYNVTNDGWNASSTPLASVKTFDLVSVTGLDNQATVFFRLVVASTVSANGGVLAVGGTSRVDNFLVTATPISSVPEPSSFAALAGAAALAGTALRRRRKQA